MDWSVFYIEISMELSLGLSVETINNALAKQAAHTGVGEPIERMKF